MPPSRIIALLILASSLQASCTPTDMPSDRSGALLEKLEAGTVSLDCRLSCASQFGADRRRRDALISAHRWVDLGLYVEQSNYDSNLSWYYLGRAAQALGYVDAARKYYQVAIDETKSELNCRDLVDVCEGVHLPRDAQTRLAALLNIAAIPRSQPLPDPATIKDSGTVTVAFDIAADGTVRSPKIVSSEPAGRFDAISLAAVSSWRYEPRRVGGRAAPQPGNRVSLHFAPEDGPAEKSQQIIYEPPPNYPRLAFKDGVAGWADVRFTVNELGLVDSAIITRSSPPGIFNMAALNKVLSTVYVPPTVNGKPARIAALTEHVRFDPGNAQFAPEKLQITPPEYPSAANALGFEGRCSVLLNLDKDGSVKSFRILEESFPGMFAKACLEAASSMRYKPPGSDPTGRTGSVAEFSINFAINEKARHLLNPGDWFRLQFDVSYDGTFKRVRVLEKSPNAGPDGPIVSALQTLRFSSKIPDADGPTGSTHTLTLISPSKPPDLRQAAK